VLGELVSENAGQILGHTWFFGDDEFHWLVPFPAFPGTVSPEGTVDKALM
jgi:hypothetical protein